MQKKIRRALVVFKPKAYHYFVEGPKPAHPSITKLRAAHRSHLQTIRLVKKILREEGVPFDIETGAIRKNVGRYDLLITVGGDGTFLRTSHVSSRHFMLGINSCPGMSVGALCSVVPWEFRKKIRQIARGKWRIRELNRLQIRVNGRPLKALALNDILFSSHFPAGTSRYVLRIGAREEDQKSSGMWIATATGSTAGIYAAGGKKLPLLSRNIQYFVREPYGRNRYRLNKGILKPGAKIGLVNMSQNAVLYVDGMQAIYPIRFGDRMVIGNARRTLRVLI